MLLEVNKLAKLTEEQIERLREYWNTNNKHLHISLDGKVIESSMPTDNWWCIDKEYLLLNGKNSQEVIYISENIINKLLKKLFESKDTTIIEIYYALGGGYSK